MPALVLSCGHHRYLYFYRQNLSDPQREIQRSAKRPQTKRPVQLREALKHLHWVNRNRKSECLAENP